MASKELESRIQKLIGEEDTSMPKTYMMRADRKAPAYASIRLPESLSKRQAGSPYQNFDIKEVLADYASRVGTEFERGAAESLEPYLEELTGINRNDPDFTYMLASAGITTKDFSDEERNKILDRLELPAAERRRMSDQDMNVMMANQGARKGISPVEQRGMTFANYLRQTDRTAPEEVVNNYAIGNMSFDDAIQLSQPIQVIDEVSVTGQMPDMTPTTRPVSGGQMTNADYDIFMQSAMTPSAGMTDTKMMELQQALQELETQRQMTNDPEEKELLGRMIENAKTKAFAPQADLVDQLSQGAGEDDMMAHVRSGDINVSKEMLENNPQLEDMIEQAALEVGIDPESMVYGTGIASLNEITGAEQHGFLKKIAKGIKKVAKVIAPVAAVVPGPWQAPAIAYNRGRAVVNIAKGKGGIGDLMTAAAGVGDKAGFFGGTPSFNPTAGATSTAGGGISDILGRTKEFIFKGADDKNLLQNVAGGIGKLLGGGGLPQPVQGEGGELIYQDSQGNVITQQEYEQLASQQGSFFGRKTPQLIKSVGDAIGLGGASGLRDVYGGDVMTDSEGNPIIDPTTGQPMRSGFLRNAQGGLSGMGMLGIGALATGLGKLAYEDTKKQKGVQLTPLLTMNAAGRYNLEAEMARRMGQQPPNPTEFGLLPANTMPQLSGGQPRLEEQVMAAAQGGEVEYPNKGLEALSKVAPDVVRRMGYNMGGQVMMPMNYNMGSRPMMPMAYAEGGNVAMEDFERMNGQINGEGTETSDDIPAMLSDGEFVMTGQAVRGAGTYDMKNDSGILTLTPSNTPSRDGGTDLMYKLMEAFSSQARPA